MQGLQKIGRSHRPPVAALPIPVGMHQFPNTFLRQQPGSFTDAPGTVRHGEIPRFFHGDPTAGQFMTGFFLIAMFALSAAAPHYALFRFAITRSDPRTPGRGPEGEIEDITRA